MSAQGDEAVCSTEFMVLTARPPFTRSYLYCLALSSSFRQQLEGMVTGTSRSHQRAPAKAVLSMETLIPPSEIVQPFDTRVSGSLCHTLSARRESEELATLRDAFVAGVGVGGG